MADVSDVQDAIVTAIEAARVAVGGTWSIARGFPEPAVLDAAMKAGVVLVTVFMRTGYHRLTTRFPNAEHELPRVAPTLTMTVAGITVTVAGVCSPDQIAGVKGRAGEFSTRCAVGDTPTTVAGRLAGAGRVSGPVLTVPGLVAARVARDVATVRPTRQQEVGITVTVWSTDPGQRDDTSRTIDAWLSDDNQRFLRLNDGSAAWVRSAGGQQTDKAQMSAVYRQDIFLNVEFSTLIQATRPTVLFPDYSLTRSF